MWVQPPEVNWDRLIAGTTRSDNKSDDDDDAQQGKSEPLPISRAHTSMLVVIP